MPHEFGGCQGATHDEFGITPSFIGKKCHQPLIEVGKQLQPGARDLSRVPAPSTHAATGAGRLAQVELLITQGAAINAPDAAGRTPLMLAAINGHGAVVQRLLSAGANLALVDRDGLNALQHARRLGREAIAQMIEAGS